MVAEGDLVAALDVHRGEGGHGEVALLVGEGHARVGHAGVGQQGARQVQPRKGRRVGFI